LSQQRAIGAILERQGILNPEQLSGLYEEVEEKQLELLDLAVSLKLTSEEAIARAFADECGFEFQEAIDSENIPLDIAIRLPISYAKAHKILLCCEEDEVVQLVCADPLNVEALDDVRALLDREIRVRVASPTVVVNAINRVYERQDTMGELESEGEDQDDQLTDLLDSDDDAPIIRWVNALFSQAVKERASDIHIEPEEREVVVRYRVDSILPKNVYHKTDVSR